MCVSIAAAPAFGYVLKRMAVTLANKQGGFRYQPEAPPCIIDSSLNSVVMSAEPVCVSILNAAVTSVAVAPEPFQLRLVVGRPVGTGA